MARKRPHTEGTSHRPNGEMGLQCPDTQRWLTLECYGTEHVFSVLYCELSPLWQKGVSLNVGTCMVLHDHKKRRREWDTQWVKIPGVDGTWTESEEMHIEGKRSIRKCGIVDTTMYRIEKEAEHAYVRRPKMAGGRGAEGGWKERKEE